MSWKKNAFSYLTWIVYTLITGTALVSLGSTFCVEAGFAAWWGILASVLYMGIAGGITFLLYKGGGACLIFAKRNRAVFLVLESILVAGFFALGCFLRVQNIGEAETASVYYEMAEVVSGQGIPQMVHGAAYFYVRLLHTFLLLLGNQVVAGIWLQIWLQLAALSVLYFVMRKLSGAVSGIVIFGFCMCAPYIRQSALVLSPGMLYFLFLGIAAGLTVGICGSRMRFPAFAFAGVLAALCCYIDIGGGLLLILAAALAFSQQGGDAGKRLAAVGICVLAALLGFLIFIWADAFMSGKDFWRVAGAWLDLYRPKGFQLPFTIGPTSSGWESFGLFGLMAFGVFSFWCDRKREYHSVYVVAACVIMLASCFGIYTEEMPGYFSLYLMFVVLAGVGLKPCVCSNALPDTLSGIVGEEAGGITEEFCPGGENGLSVQMQQDEESGLNAQMQQDEENRERDEPAEDAAKEEKKVRYLDNPLPLPKKHVKRVMDYSINVSCDDDFDYPIKENDDFDM